MHLTTNELTVDPSREVVAILERLNVVRCVLVMLRVLVAGRVMDVDVSIIVINHDNPTAIGYVVHILGPVILLLLRCLITLLLGLNIIKIVLIQTLLGHTDLVRPNPPMLAPSSWPLGPTSSHR